MICKHCRDRHHARCLSVDCCCRHSGSTVRPLSQRERHEYMLGLPLPIVLPLETR